jgi:hypothetical protein
LRQAGKVADLDPSARAQHTGSGDVDMASDPHRPTGRDDRGETFYANAIAKRDVGQANGRAVARHHASLAHSREAEGAQPLAGEVAGSKGFSTEPFMPVLDDRCLVVAPFSSLLRLFSAVWPG